MEVEKRKNIAEFKSRDDVRRSTFANARQVLVTSDKVIVVVVAV